MNEQELIMDGNLLPIAQVGPLYREADELTAIFVASIRTVKSSLSNPKHNVPNPKSSPIPKKSPIQNHQSKITNLKSEI